MSIKLITTAWTNYQKIPKEEFTQKMMESISMSELIKDFNPKDLNRLQWLRDNTHKDICKSVYELDRYVDPTKGKISNNKYTLGSKSYTQDKIQYYLCIAIEEAQRIVYRNYKDFKIEEKANIDDDEEVEEWD